MSSTTPSSTHPCMHAHTLKQKTVFVAAMYDVYTLYNIQYTICTIRYTLCGTHIYIYDIVATSKKCQNKQVK